jgi:hypothetical protein
MIFFWRFAYFFIYIFSLRHIFSSLFRKSLLVLLLLNIFHLSIFQKFISYPFCVRVMWGWFYFPRILWNTLIFSWDLLIFFLLCIHLYYTLFFTYSTFWDFCVHTHLHWNITLFIFHTFFEPNECLPFKKWQYQRRLFSFIIFIFSLLAITRLVIQCMSLLLFFFWNNNLY